MKGNYNILLVIKNVIDLIFIMIIWVQILDQLGYRVGPTVKSKAFLR